MLSAAGATVEAWQPPPVGAAMAIWLGCLTADRGRGMKRLVRGQKVDKRAATFLGLSAMPAWLRAIVSPVLETIGQRSMGTSLRFFARGDVASYWQASEALIDYEQAFRHALDQASLDLVLCPAYGVPAVRHGAANDMPVAGAYSLLAPVLGYPSGVVPVTRVREDEESDRVPSRDRVIMTACAAEAGSRGLPVGVQLIGKPWREPVVLRAMQAIEQAAQALPDYPRTPVAVSGR